MKRIEFRYALEAGALFGFVGLFFGLGIFIFFLQTLDKVISVHTALLPSVSLFSTGLLLWWLVVVKKRQRSIDAGIVVGVAIGILSIALTYVLSRLAFAMTDQPPASMNDLRKMSSDDLLYSFWNFFSVGWVSTTICGVIGGLLAHRHKPLLAAVEMVLSVPRDDLKKEFQKETSTEIGQKPPQIWEPKKDFPAVHLSLVCPFCKGSLSEGKVTRCSVCGTRHHTACWKEHRKCSVFNCPGKEEGLSLSKKQAYAMGGIAVAAVLLVPLGFWFAANSRKNPPPTLFISPQKMNPSIFQQVTAPKDCEKDLNEKQKEQVHELLEASRFGQTNRIVSLIRSGANINSRGITSIFQPNDRCWTPLMEAAYHGNQEVLQTLIDAGSGIDIKDGSQYTALMLGVVGNHPDIIRSLLRKEADVNSVSAFGDNTLSIAAMRGNPEIIDALIRAGANVNARNLQGYPALIQAMRAKQFAAVKIFLKGKADPNITDSNGKTPLSWATELGDEETVNELLKAGAYANVKDEDGVTPLMYATLVGNPEIIRALIRAGADPNAVDVRGTSPLAYARQNSRQDLIKILRESGAK